MWKQIGNKHEIDVIMWVTDTCLLPLNLLCARYVGKVSWCPPDSYPSSAHFYTLFSLILPGTNFTWTARKHFSKAQVLTLFPSFRADKGRMGVSSVLGITLRFRSQIHITLWPWTVLSNPGRWYFFLYKTGGENSTR